MIITAETERDTSLSKRVGLIISQTIYGLLQYLEWNDYQHEQKSEKSKEKFECKRLASFISIRLTCQNILEIFLLIFSVILKYRIFYGRPLSFHDRTSFHDYN